jgi:hypothetical protein
VTVCIGAIAEAGENPIIFGVTDRMLTAGDIQYEPARSKVFSLTNASAILIAGDASTQEEICLGVQQEVGKRLDEDPERWIPIADIAGFYRKHYMRVQAQAAERAVLGPLGMTTDEFLANETLASSELGRSLADQLRDYGLPDTEAVILGLDTTGPHVFRAFSGDMMRLDSIGFATAGIGAWHASSQLMNGGYTPYASFLRAAVLVLLAKRRAEVAPGVGKQTDIVAIGPELGQYVMLEPEVVKQLEDIIDGVVDRENLALDWGVEKLGELLEAESKKAQQAADTNNGGSQDERK